MSDKRENIYQRDLGVHFAQGGFAYVAQKKISMYDSLNGDVLIGYYIPDFIVEKIVVVEIKALSGLDNSHLAQIIGYLAVTGCPIGLLINLVLVVCNGGVSFRQRTSQSTESAASGFSSQVGYGSSKQRMRISLE